ncbi:hypothetical protein H4S08_004461, partial [Coemansia sp. RSA 1365]
MTPALNGSPASNLPLTTDPLATDANQGTDGQDMVLISPRASYANVIAVGTTTGRPARGTTKGLAQ